MPESALSFQLLLLGRMSASYRDAVLAEVGMSAAEAVRISQACRLLLPQQLGVDLSTYSSLLGQPVNSNVLSSAPPLFAGSVAHDFVLPLWPHLYWTVNSRPDGGSWGVGFRNQEARGTLPADLRMVRRGVWTRSALERLADRAVVHDGWDERVVLRLDVGNEAFLADFAFGLLQDWRPVESAFTAGGEAS